MELLTSLYSTNDAYRLEYCFSDRLLDSSAAEWGGPGQTPSAAFGSTLTVRGRSVVLLGRGFN